MKILQLRKRQVLDELELFNGLLCLNQVVQLDLEIFQCNSQIVATKLQGKTAVQLTDIVYFDNLF